MEQSMSFVLNCSPRDKFAFDKPLEFIETDVLCNPMIIQQELELQDTVPHELVSFSDLLFSSE